ncbi:MAG TPA: enolase C-terminal domain-like protein [Polyangiaceae bacterium]|nr:enolase C-terminal domain-like protein [Polyangiaceae bacterium]
MLVKTACLSALCVPLREPFVIATARMDTTRAGLVRLTAEERGGPEVRGLGEAACLHPVTREDLPDVERAWPAAEERVVGAEVNTADEAHALALAASPSSPVLAAALECALVDALARARGVSVRALFGCSAPAATLESDVTIPIAEEAEMLRVGRRWYAQGFRAFKVKVGRDAEREARAMCSLHTSLPGLRLRLDANGGFTAEEALATLRALGARGAAVECFEQPCDREDLEGMARVARDGGVPVVADESFRGPLDLDDLVRAKAATAVNLKLVKLGGFGPSLALGREARRRGLELMVGGMVETRLGMTCAATLATCFDAVAYADLDTAWLLESDPFEGGFSSDGPRIRVTGGLGFDVRDAG